MASFREELDMRRADPAVRGSKPADAGTTSEDVLEVAVGDVRTCVSAPKNNTFTLSYNPACEASEVVEHLLRDALERNGMPVTMTGGAVGGDTNIYFGEPVYYTKTPAPAPGEELLAQRQQVIDIVRELAAQYPDADAAFKTEAGQQVIKKTQSEHPEILQNVEDASHLAQTKGQPFTEDDQHALAERFTRTQLRVDKARDRENLLRALGRIKQDSQIRTPQV